MVLAEVADPIKEIHLSNVGLAPATVITQQTVKNKEPMQTALKPSFVIIVISLVMSARNAGLASKRDADSNGHIGAHGEAPTPNGAVGSSEHCQGRMKPTIPQHHHFH